MDFYPKDPRVNPELAEQLAEKRVFERKLVEMVKTIPALYHSNEDPEDQKKRTKIWDDLAANSFPGSEFPEILKFLNALIFC